MTYNGPMHLCLMENGLDEVSYTITTACNRPDLQSIQSRCPLQKSITLQRFTLVRKQLHPSPAMGASGLCPENSSNIVGHVLQPALPLLSSHREHSWKQPTTAPKNSATKQPQIRAVLSSAGGALHVPAEGTIPPMPVLLMLWHHIWTEYSSTYPSEKNTTLQWGILFIDPSYAIL